MPLPSLKQLQYLVALYDHQHFGHAADSCNVTQSTLSAGLKELEATLGLQLVERTRRMVVFTPVGVHVVHQAQDLLQRAENLSLVSKNGLNPLGGQVRLSLIPTIAPFVLPRMLGVLREVYPQLEFQFHEEMSHEGCAGLSKGARDCMLIALPYDCGNFEYAALFEDPIVVAVREDDPLAKEAVIDPVDLPAERLLLLQEGHCLRDHALSACQRSGQSPRSAPSASIPTLIQLVNEGFGITLLPQMAVAAGLTSGTRIVTRPLAGDDAKRIIALAWRPNCPRTREFTVLSAKMREILQSAWTIPPRAISPVESSVRKNQSA